MKLKEYWNILMNTTFLSYLNINLHKIKLILFRNEIFEYRIVCFLLKYGNHQKKMKTKKKKCFSICLIDCFIYQKQFNHEYNFLENKIF